MVYQDYGGTLLLVRHTRRQPDHPLERDRLLRIRLGGYIYVIRSSPYFLIGCTSKPPAIMHRLSCEGGHVREGTVWSIKDVKDVLGNTH